jgi:hypothetical protein
MGRFAPVDLIFSINSIKDTPFVGVDLNTLVQCQVPFTHLSILHRNFNTIFKFDSNCSTSSVSAIYWETNTSHPVSIIARQYHSHPSNILRHTRSFKRVPTFEVLPWGQISGGLLENSSLRICLHVSISKRKQISRVTHSQGTVH